MITAPAHPVSKGKVMLYDAGILICIVITCAIVVGLVSQSFFGPDNVIEDFCEDVVESETGISLDFSPENRE